MTTTKRTTKISNVGYNKKDGQYYATFEFEKKLYMITWRPKNKEEGIEFDVGILPVKEENNGLSKRVNGEKKQNATSIGGNEKRRS